ncbi:uncharacterized protein IL334_003637 [Kwoniella shivajii]|uniref:C3HC-type domain-containing protein n=1 Tax=Kwoniella shivajii TaxID=564305 RepID=A0ABZ1CZA7_9TREE|nr:hypothetical protein IL334_003637 [Kwoniella shivajii]
MMSEGSSPDPDLRDVFRLLYSEDEWNFPSSDSEGDDDGEIHPPLNDLAPEIEVEIVESDLMDEISSNTERYTRKRYIEALDSLLSSSPSVFSSSSTSTSTASPGQNKKQRIYPCPPSSNNGISQNIILSTQPIPSPLPSAQLYAPYSPLALLSRLRTYQIHTYPYPLLNGDTNTLSPLNASLKGWYNHSRNTLRCGSCHSAWSINGLDDITNEQVRIEVAKRLSKGFQDNHTKTCPWKTRCSPANLYDQLRNSLHPLITSHLSPLSQILNQSIISLSSISLTSPLNPIQESSLLQSLSNHSSSVSSSSAILALFGWFPYYPNAPCTKVTVGSNPETDIIHCRICQRRIGLWSFLDIPSEQNDKAKRKTLDLVDEHLNWCPLSGYSKEWWEGCLLIREKSPALIGGTIKKDWVILSDKLEKKPWRRTKI